MSTRTRNKSAAAAPVINEATVIPQAPATPSRYAAFERLSDGQLASLASLAKRALSVKSKLGQLDRNSLPHGSISLSSRGAVIRHEASKAASERTEAEKKAVEILKEARQLIAALGDNPFLSASDLTRFTAAS